MLCKKVRYWCVYKKTCLQSYSLLPNFAFATTRCEVFILMMVSPSCVTSLDSLQRQQHVVGASWLTHSRDQWKLNLCPIKRGPQVEHARGNLKRGRLNSYIYKPFLPLLVQETIDYVLWCFDLSYAKPLVFSYHRICFRLKRNAKRNPRKKR